MHFIKQLVEGAPEGWVHERFIRYGRGSYVGPSIFLQSSAKSIKASSTVDYSNLFGEMLSEIGGSFSVSGTVFIRRDVEDDLGSLGFSVGKTKKKGTLRTIEIKGELQASQLKEFYQKLSDAIILVDLVSAKEKSYKLKCKKKLPKPGSELDVKACNVVLPKDAIKKIIDESLFDFSKQSFNEAKVTNKYEITDLVAGDEVKKDASLFRIEAQRKGTLVREIEVDGEKLKKEYSLTI
ncbi:MAG: hypothetical protein ABH950_05745 [Candidatus Altiarchaeota archaeon]